MAHVLVVDDDHDVLAFLERLLALHGLECTGVTSGEAALARIDAAPPDLVLLDVRLPGIDGIETCRRIRARHGLALPVVLMTAVADADSLSRGYEAGADEFLDKPLDPRALVLKLRAFLRLRELFERSERASREAQARARSLAQLHEISRDWSLIARPEEFVGMVCERLATLIGAPICLLALYDAETRTLAAAHPAHGLAPEVVRQMRLQLRPEHRGLWNLRAGRAHVTPDAQRDPRLAPELAQVAGIEQALLVPMLAEGRVLGVIAACNKPDGFDDDDAQVVSIFAGPAATFLRNRQIFEQQRRQATRQEVTARLMGAMAATHGRGALVETVVGGLRRGHGYARVAFHALRGDELAIELEAGSAAGGGDAEWLRWAVHGQRPLRTPQASRHAVALPVRAGTRALGVLEVGKEQTFEELEIDLLGALADQLAVGLEKAAGLAEAERLARQMATLYELGLETAALRDLRSLFERATEEAGRLIGADHASVFRLDEGELRLFAGWARDRAGETYGDPRFALGEGVVGRVARDSVPALVNDPGADPSFVTRGNPVARLLCVPITYYDPEARRSTTFGVLNATRRPGARPFTPEDLDGLMRFAGQLQVAAANAFAFAAERRRSEQLGLVNRVLREIASSLSPERVLETAVQRIQEAFRFPAVLAIVPDALSGLNRVACASCDPPRPGGFPHYPTAAGLTARVLRERRTVHVPDVTRDPDYLALVPGTRSELLVPVLSGDEVVAVLDVESDRPHAFDHGVVLMMETLADGIAITLRNAELFRALEESHERLIELDRTKSEVVNIVAHDVRSPLFGILGRAELLLAAGGTAEEASEHATAIAAAARHMAALVDKTLATTRLESGHFPFEFGVLDLGAALHAVAARWSRDPQHPLVVELAEEPLPVWGDRERLVEVAENLLSNAVKYSPRGGEIVVRAARADGRATVEVADRGIGIPAADLARLFRPFSRLRRPETAAIEGSGLGLYICDRILRAHGARLALEEREGGGTRVHFSLPLFTGVASVRRPVLLVAAADAATLRDVRGVAQARGYEVHEATDGVEALEAVRRLVPDVAVLDHLLPRLQGEEVAERLAEHEVTRHVPLVALAEPTVLGRRGALFRASVPRPVDREALARALDVATAGREAPEPVTADDAS